MPQAAFLFSIAGLSLTLVGFSGLVAALRRDAPRSALDAYRLRQIPEMALATALVALISLPLADTFGDARPAIRAGAGFGLAFTVFHIVLLVARTRRQGLRFRGVNWILVALVDVAVLATGILAVITGTSTSYEWLLVALTTRPAIAFVVALGDVSSR